MINIIWRLKLLGFSGEAISEMLDNQLSKSQIYEISDNANFGKIGENITDLRIQVSNLSFASVKIAYE